MAKGDGTCGQEMCLGSLGVGRKQSRLEATLSVCAVTIVVSDMAKYSFEVYVIRQFHTARPMVLDFRRWLASSVPFQRKLAKRDSTCVASVCSSTHKDS